MRLLTEEIAKSLPPLGSTSDQGREALARVKFFTPDSGWTWYATEYDPETRIFFGLVKGLETEFGTFSLDELEGVRGKLGLPVERDFWFRPRPVGALHDEAVT
jgi:hypothetical protein